MKLSSEASITKNKHVLFQLCNFMNIDNMVNNIYLNKRYIKYEINTGEKQALWIINMLSR